MKEYDKDEVVDTVRLTAEQQYEYSSNYWVEMYFRLCRTFAEDLGLGWDKVNEALKITAKDGWPFANDSLGKLDIKDNDSRVWAFTESTAGQNAWPGYIDDVVDFSPECTSIKGSGKCIALDTIKRLGLEGKVDLLPWCASHADGGLRGVNPKLRFVQTMAMCRGDEYDMGATELTDHKVTGSKHSYEQARAFSKKTDKNK